MRSKIVDHLLWALPLALLILLYFSGCAASRIVTGPDGQPAIEVVGENAFPGAAEKIGDAVGTPTEDIVGAAGDALKKVDVPEAISAAKDRNWLGLGAIIFGFLSALVGGVVARRKIRKKRGL